MNPSLEGLRRRYLPPEGIRVLLVGESPPGNGGFFHQGDSTLYSFAVPVFVEECGWPMQRAEFLRRFASEGFYLEDLSLIPGRKIAELTEEEEREAIDRVSKLISEHRPEAVVAVLKTACELVRRCVEAASTVAHVPLRCITFPNRRFPQRQAAFQTEFRAVLREFGCSGSRPTETLAAQPERPASPTD